MTVEGEKSCNRSMTTINTEFDIYDAIGPNRLIYQLLSCSLQVVIYTSFGKSFYGKSHKVIKLAKIHNFQLEINNLTCERFSMLGHVHL